jgi:tRNA wybutosine-synthesizing protein 4
VVVFTTMSSKTKPAKPAPTGVTSVGMDKAVQGTNDDAAVSKLSMCNRGYLKDEYIQFFVTKPTKRAPVINRGYYARVAAVWEIVRSFTASYASQSRECQVVVLGAGYDTMPLRMIESQTHMPVRYIEVDFPRVMLDKYNIICKHALVKDGGVDTSEETLVARDIHSFCHAEAPSSSSTDASSSTSSCSPSARPASSSSSSSSSAHKWEYHLVGADLRDAKALESQLQAANMDVSLPTLFLSECCMVYMDPDHSDGVIRMVADLFGEEKKGGGAVFVTYEQLYPDDPFGRTMVGHLASRGAYLRSLHKYPDPASQNKRYRDLGWDTQATWDMNKIYRTFMDAHDVRRIEKLEMFDEYEEWHLFQGHYCISMACIDTNISEGVNAKAGFLDVDRYSEDRDPLHRAELGGGMPNKDVRLSKLNAILAAKKKKNQQQQ